jgi:outer membrane scaffolding protein for murein synthesis (MipA/OmpV family)
VKFILPLAVAGLTLAAPAFAQDAPDPNVDGDGTSITIGGGVAYLPDYEGSNDYRFVPGPAAVGQVKGYAFQLAGNRLSVDLVRNAPGPVWDIQLGPVAVVNFNRSALGAIDDARVRALGKLDRAIELGGYVGIGKTGVITSPYDRLSVSLSYRHDVTGTHDSYVLTPTINYLTPLSTKAAVAVFASADRVGGGYARTYYGVLPVQSVASGLPTYTPGASWKSYTLGGLATVALTGDLLQGFKLVAGGGYTRMLDDVARAPIVRIAGDRDQWLGAVGVAYTF